MNEEIISRFLNQKVKLVKENFAIYGTIISVEKDFLVFKTKSATSIISLDVITEITPIYEGGGL